MAHRKDTGARAKAGRKAGKKPHRGIRGSNGAPPRAAVKASKPAGHRFVASSQAGGADKPRLLPDRNELKTLYERYTNSARFDEHDKAFYFVLDVGGISRAKQLIAHVAEVLAELEEFDS